MNAIVRSNEGHLLGIIRFIMVIRVIKVIMAAKVIGVKVIRVISYQGY